MEREDKQDVFEGFDLTNLEEFSSFMEEREGTDDSSLSDDDTTQQQQGDDDPFAGFNTIEVDEDGDPIETEDDNEDTPSSSDTKKPEKNSFLTPYAKLLMEEGVLQDFDVEKFDGSADSLVEAFKQQVNRHVESYKETLDPRVKWLQDNVEQGVPLETLLAIDKQRVELNTITPELLSENKDLQKNLVRNYLKSTTTGWSDAKIEREIARLDDLGELDTEAKESFEILKQLNAEQEKQLAIQAKTEREAALKAQQDALNNFKKSLDETKEIIPGLNVTPAIKDKIFKTLTTPVATDPNGNPMNMIAKARAENPLEFEMKLAYIFELTKGFKDWSPMITPGKKSAIKEFEEAARKLDYNKSGGDAPTFDKASQKELMKAMSIFAR